MNKDHQRPPAPSRHAAAPQSHSSTHDTADRLAQSGPPVQSSGHRPVTMPPTANLFALGGALGNQAIIQQLRSRDRGATGGVGMPHERIASGPGLLQRAIFIFNIVPAPKAEEEKAPAKKSKASKGSTSAAAPEVNADDAYLKWLNECHEAAKALGQTYTPGKGKGNEYTTTYQGVSVTVRLDQEKGKFYPRVSFGDGKDLKTEELYGLMDTITSKTSFIAGVKGEKREKRTSSYQSGLGVRAVLLASDHIDHPGNLYITKRFLAKVSEENYRQLYRRGDKEQSYGALPSQNTNTVRESSQERIAAYKAVSELIDNGTIKISDANTNIPKLRKILAMATFDPDLFTKITRDGKKIDIQTFEAHLDSKLIDARWHQRKQRSAKDSTVNEFSDVEESENPEQSEYEKYSGLDSDNISAERRRLEEMQRQLAIKIRALSRLEKEKAELEEQASSSGSEEVAKKKVLKKKSIVAKKEVASKKKELVLKEKEVKKSQSEQHKRKRSASSNTEESADIAASHSTEDKKPPKRYKPTAVAPKKQESKEKPEKAAPVIDEQKSTSKSKSKHKQRPAPKKRARSISGSTDSDQPAKKAPKKAKAASERSRSKQNQQEPKKKPGNSPQKRQDSRKRSSKKEEDS